MGIRANLAALIAAGCVGACSGGGGGGGSAAPTTFSLGGTVAGLSSSGLVLQLNGTTTVNISPAGGGGVPFAFPVLLSPGAAYNVTVLSNPTAPAQACRVSGGSGTMPPGSVGNIFVSCSSSLFVGGTVTGLHGSGVFLLLDSDKLSSGFSVFVSADGPFTFPAAVLIGGTYNVTVSNPPGQNCTVSHGTGTIAFLDVTDVSITCVDVFFSVGGTVTGVQGSGLVLQINGGGNLSISADGPFTFAPPLLKNSAYNVTVLSNPTKPKQICTVTQGSGNNLLSTVDSVAVSCRTPLTIGGTVSGLTGAGLVLRNNCNTDLPIAAAGDFTFPGEQFQNSTYGVSVLTQPAGQTCVVAKGAGTVTSLPITDVDVVCGIPGFSVTTVSDPLAPQQWHLRNTCQTGFADTPGVAGIDVNVDAAYGLFNVTGSGVTVGVVDTGLEIAHEDLSANVVPGGSWNFNNLTTDPTSTATTGDHGTSVSGLIAMTRSTVGGMGVAPAATLKGFNFLSSTQSLTNFLDSIGASTANPNSSDVFIFNQSFGIETNVPVQPDLTEESNYVQGTISLRGGKGAIYVKAAGNGFRTVGTVTCFFLSLISCENANFDPTNTFPSQIVVGSVNANGVKASYSTAGSAIWISAPGGEFGFNASLFPGATPEAYQPAMVTTDQSSCAKGFSRTGANTSAFDNGGAPNASCNYTNTMNGTSSATPVTSGVIALMLEANPALTWRDVKHVLASTARQIDPGRLPVHRAVSDGDYIEEPAWTTNHASPTPFHFHNWYGFGLVDAAAAVSMAKSYPLGQLGTFTDTGIIRSPAAIDLAIPDSSVIGATSTIAVPAGTVQFVEAVQIGVSVTHPSISELTIELTSPQGTRSVVKNSGDGYQSNFLFSQVFLSNAFYGENPIGTWTLKVLDGVSGGLTGTLQDWGILVFGH